MASLALLDHRKLQFWPSTVAASVVILVSLSEKREDSCQRVMKVYIHINPHTSITRFLAPSSCQYSIMFAACYPYISPIHALGAHISEVHFLFKIA